MMISLLFLYTENRIHVQRILTQIGILIHKSKVSMSNGLFVLTMSLKSKLTFKLRHPMDLKINFTYNE